jgi:hypothetical protein
VSVITENLDAAEAVCRLWRLLGILTITTTIFFAVLTGVTATAADLPFFLTVFIALVAPPAATLVCLHTGRPRLAVYSSIPGVLLSAGACCFMLFAFFAPFAGLIQILLYPVGIAFAVPYGYASILQLKVGAAICVRKRSRRLVMTMGNPIVLLKP